MEISFLNVGHGDSIILKWLEKGIKKIGIIDCSTHNGSNPVVNYLKSCKDLSEIEFIALSHPHIDHYSGFPELFEFIENNSIVIRNFLHTLIGDPSYLKWAETSKEDRKMLDRVLAYLIDFKDKKKLIETIHLPSLNWSMELGNNYVIKTLSPSDSEIRTRIAKINFYEKENRFLCSTSSNYLSSIYLLKNKRNNRCFLLTSDATDYTFRRLLNSKLINDEINGTQIPHHGSSKSLVRKFWKDNLSKNEANAYISAGLNNRYELPDYKVIEFFDHQGIALHITNEVHGYKDYFEELSKESYKICTAMDDDSEIIRGKYNSNSEINYQL